MSAIEVLSRTQRIIVASPSSVRVVSAGAVGPRGLPGEPGPPGAAASSYTHTQDTPATEWTIIHNLGFYPNIQVMDSAGTVWLVEVHHDSINQATVFITVPFAGKANCS